MKSHDEIREMLAAMAGDDLSEADRNFVRQHLADCPSCRSELAQLKIVMQAQRALPEVEPPPWLKTRIMALVKEETKPEHSWLKRLFLPLHVKLPIEGFALLMVCVVAWYVMQDMDRSRQMKIIAPESQTPVSEALRDAAEPPASKASQAYLQAEKRKEKVAATPVPKPSLVPAFAPPPSLEKAQPDQSAQIMAKDEAVEAAPVVREQTVGVTSGMAGHKTQANMLKARKADSSPAGVARPLLSLRVADRETIKDQLQTIAERLGGALVDCRQGSCVIRVETRHWPQLLEQTAELGQVLEQPRGVLTTEGMAELQVVW